MVQVKDNDFYSNHVDVVKKFLFKFFPPTANMIPISYFVIHVRFGLVGVEAMPLEI